MAEFNVPNCKHENLFVEAHAQIESFGAMALTTSAVRVIRCTNCRTIFPPEDLIVFLYNNRQELSNGQE